MRTNCGAKVPEYEFLNTKRVGERKSKREDEYIQKSKIE